MLNKWFFFNRQQVVEFFKKLSDQKLKSTILEDRAKTVEHLIHLQVGLDGNTEDNI